MKNSGKNLFIIMGILLIFVVGLTSYAQSLNDPTVNDDANACSEGGTLEGYCNITDVDADGDVDESDAEWMWTCGWYLIRADYAMIAREDIPLAGCELPERIIPIKEKKKVVVVKTLA